jgi:hypothetical protein
MNEKLDVLRWLANDFSINEEERKAILAVLADLAALRERCEQMRDALLVVRAHVDQWGELNCTDTAWSTMVTALRYYAADWRRGE